MAEIKHLLTILSPPERVYRAITEQAGLASWWTKDAKAKPEIGSVAEFKFGYRYHNKMRIARLEPYRYVSWECLEGDAEWIGTTFTFELDPLPEGTRLRFTQASWREATDFFASCNYRWGYYMQSLKSYCETGHGTPFQ